MKTGEKSKPQLKRSINLFQAVMYGVGLILGAGIYVLIGDAAGLAGNAMWISFVIAAVIAAFTGLSYAELSSVYPKSAAEYVFVKNSLRNNLVAFVTGWLITFVAIVSAAAVAIGFSGYLGTFLPDFNPILSAVLLTAALSAINFIGIRESIWMNTTFAMVEVAGLVIVVLAAMLLGTFSSTDFYQMPPAASTSLALSAGALLAAAGLIFFAYFGFENLANIAEETKNPSRTIPRALVASILITTAIYIAVAVSATSLVGWQDLSSSDAPLAVATQKAFGGAGAVVLSAIALFATTNTVLMMLIAASRIMFGLASDRALPAPLSRVHHKTKTPWIAVAITMFLVMGVIVLSQGSIAAVANSAVFAIFMVYALVNLSLIWLRYKQPQLERPFRSPLRIGRFPVLGGLGLATSLAMLTQFDSTSVIAGFSAIAAALATYVVICRHKTANRLRDDMT